MFINEDLGAGCAHGYWVVTDPRPTQWTQLYKCIAICLSTYVY